ncbi:MAG: tetratricopeptide repeat protein [Magnetococcales bacterium]|nr:tetratricopeptide repeat protein [Magnetococcales bacterium]
MHSQTQLTIDEAYKQAVDHFNAEKYTQSDQLCTAILQAIPNHIDALNLLGVIAQRVNRHDLAVEQFSKAINIDNKRAVIHCNLAVSLNNLGEVARAKQSMQTACELQPDNIEFADYLKKITEKKIATNSDDNTIKASARLQRGIEYHQKGHLKEAIICYKSCLEYAPDNEIALANLGVALKKEGKLDEAVACYQRSIAVNPNIADIHLNLANVYKAQNRFAAAIECYNRVISINPDYIQVYVYIANIFAEKGDIDQGIASLQNGLKIQRDNPELLCNLATLLARQGRLEQAVENFKKALTIKPDYPEALSNLGLAYMEQGLLDEGIVEFNKAIAINPNYAEAYNNLANCFKKQDKLSQAVEMFQKAITINPQYADAYSNLGSTYKAQGRLKKAIKSQQQAVAIAPNYTKAIKNLALSQLLDGDFTNGWQNFNQRWQDIALSSTFFNNSNMTLWQGGDIDGKKLLLWDEQGVGESLLFATMIPDLVKLGAKVVLQCDERLIPLFLRSFKEIECLPNGSIDSLKADELEFDHHTPMGNLGRWFRPDLSSFVKQKAHIVVDDEKKHTLKTRYKKSNNQFIVGISWHSKSPKYGDKSIELKELYPILKIPGVQFINLQYGDTAKPRDELFNDSGIQIYHDESIDQLADLDSFSAQVAAVDLVVTISNTTAHMAGAVGTPTFLLLESVPIWYWMMDVNHSPWYSSLRLFRQQKRGEWRDVIRDVAKEVAGFINNTER